MTFLPFFQLERLKRGEDRVGFGLKDLLNGIFEPISLLSQLQIHIKRRLVEKRIIPRLNFAHSQSLRKI